MKILLDSNGLEIIDDFSYSYKLDSYRRESVYYKFILECKECGKSYFMRMSYPGVFCSRQCANKSVVIRNKIAKSLTGNKKSIEECTAISKRKSKGDVVKLNVPLYDTYAKQLLPVEEVRRNKSNFNILEVKCILCNRWFIPKRIVCEQRCQFIKGNTDRENRFYCSDMCKINCSIFHKKKYPTGVNPIKHRNSLKSSDLRLWSKEVIQRANGKCEICGKKAILAHHKIPKKINIHLALDPDNGMACCQKCHNQMHTGEYSFGMLANRNCM